MSHLYPHDEALDSSIDFKISTGHIPGYRHIHKFGATEIGSTVLQDIWSFGGIKQYATTAVPVFMWSTDDTDDQLIRVSGLDEDWNFKIIEINLTGHTPVQLPGVWLRVFKSRNWGITDFLGTVYIARSSALAPAAPALADAEASLEPLTQGTQMTQFSVPVGHTAFIKNFFTGTEKGVDIKSYGFHRNFGKVFTGEEILATYQGSVSKVLPYLAFPEKSDFTVRGIADTTNSYLAASYDIILVQNDPHLI